MFYHNIYGVRGEGYARIFDSGGAGNDALSL